MATIFSINGEKMKIFGFSCHNAHQQLKPPQCHGKGANPIRMSPQPVFKGHTHRGLHGQRIRRMALCDHQPNLALAHTLAWDIREFQEHCGR
jgi:4-hydroxyphenylpyruvate dioxygenase-like putative hemolysin